MPDVEMAFRGRLASTAAVRALVGDRIRHSMAAQVDAMPYITYTMVSETPVDHLTGYANVSTALIQADAFARTPKQAVAVGRQIKAAWRNLRNTSIVTGDVTTDIRSASIAGARDTIEPAGDGSDEHIYRVSIDVNLNYREN